MVDEQDPALPFPKVFHRGMQDCVHEQSVVTNGAHMCGIKKPTIPARRLSRDTSVRRFPLLDLCLYLMAPAVNPGGRE